jgi:hypothetical protein
MSDGGRDRASLEMEVWKSSQKMERRRSAVRSIAWFGLGGSQLWLCVTSSPLLHLLAWAAV